MLLIVAAHILPYTLFLTILCLYVVNIVIILLYLFFSFLFHFENLLFSVNYIACIVCNMTFCFGNMFGLRHYANEAD